MMKKLLSVLTALMLLAAGSALAAHEVFTGPDGTQFYGMMLDGNPVGFIALRQPAGDKLMFGVIRQDMWQGSLYSIVLDESGAFDRLIIQQYADNQQQAALHCLRDGRLVLYSYTDGVMTGMMTRDANGALAYSVVAGEVRSAEEVAVASLEDTALYTAGITLHAASDEQVTTYAALDDEGEPFVSVQIHPDGSVVATRHFDGECMSYSAADNTCTVGMMQDGAWAPGAMIIRPDGSTGAIE